MKLFFLFFIFVSFGCQPPLEHQPRVNPFSESSYFSNGSSARSQVEGTVDFYQASEGPVRLTPQLLALGQRTYDIHCSICHGLTGHGDGVVTERGFEKPPKFRSLSSKEVEQIISDGKKSMPSFRGKLGPKERWAVAHYVRVLVLRENLTPGFLNQEDLKNLNRESK